MKKFFEILFWRRDPKAGALFGLLLVCVALTVFLPVYALSVVSLFTDGKSFGAASWVAGVMSAYGVVLQLAFAWNVVLCKKAFARLSVGIVAAGMCGVIYALDMRMYVLFACGVFVATLAFAAAYDAAAERRAGKWKWLAPALVFVMLPAQEFMLPAFAARSERIVAETAREYGVSWEQMLHAHTNGVAEADNPHHALFTEEGEIKIDYSLRRNKSIYDAVTEEDEAAYEVFLRENAEALALLDEMTAAPIEKPEAVFTKIWDIQTHGPISLPLIWARVYSLKTLFATRRGDAAAVEDAIRRRRNIADFTRRFPLLTPRLVCYSLEEGRVNNISFALRALPDETLESLQSEMSCAPENARDLQRCMCEELVFYRELINETLTRPVRDVGVPQWERKDRISRYLAPLAYVRMLYPVFDKARGFVKQFDAPADSESQRLRRYYEMMPKLKNSPVSPWFLWGFDYIRMLGMNLPGHIRLLEQRNAAMIGIAAERYRRAHGELPETLDALVPEFLESVPDSVFNDGPFAYERGEVNATGKSWYDPVFTRGFQISSEYELPDDEAGIKRRVVFTVPDGEM
ncbi:MAG: hypothetical protein FWG05_00285 [Kiritimatiellaeota bacterium]|nr:hypothetical protein [Kiritimatiellota bacterium]